MYHHLATMDSVTDRWTDRRQYNANSQSPCMPYAWLIKNWNKKWWNKWWN